MRAFEKLTWLYFIVSLLMLFTNREDSPQMNAASLCVLASAYMLAASFLFRSRMEKKQQSALYSYLNGVLLAISLWGGGLYMIHIKALGLILLITGIPAALGVALFNYREMKKAEGELLIYYQWLFYRGIAVAAVGILYTIFIFAF
ncbi:MAG: hypothetical protein JJT94_10960 [Bernardetiaceae bacterium]|nr:hypothetical protein [Bernardetiaceae bacterium]